MVIRTTDQSYSFGPSVIMAIFLFDSDRQLSATCFLQSQWPFPRRMTSLSLALLARKEWPLEKTMTNKECCGFPAPRRGFDTQIFLAANSNPCEHGGKCINTEGSFHCECLKGYTGPRCEMDINECHSNPCQNDATCLDKIGGFTCLCMPGEGSSDEDGASSKGKNQKAERQSTGRVVASAAEAVHKIAEGRGWVKPRERACCGGTSQEDLALVWGREKAIKGPRKELICRSAQEETFWAGLMDIFVTIPGKVPVPKVVFVKAKQVQTWKSDCVLK